MFRPPTSTVFAFGSPVAELRAVRESKIFPRRTPSHRAIRRWCLVCSQAWRINFHGKKSIPEVGWTGWQRCTQPWRATAELLRAEHEAGMRCSRLRHFAANAWVARSSYATPDRVKNAKYERERSTSRIDVRCSLARR